MKTCTNCQRTMRRTRRGLCDACQYHIKRCGRPRPPQGCVTTNKGKMCKRCRQDPARALGLCQNCEKYQRRTGQPRPRWMWNREQCTNCGRPKNRHFRRGYCLSCNRYRRKYGAERPESIWGNEIWCECGERAVHLNVPLKIGASRGGPRTETYNLCQRCYNLEHDPIQTRGEAVWNR